MKKDTSTEQKIIAAGRILFGSKGYAGTSMAEIAGEVGTTKASLYYFFKSKQALYLRILLELVDEVSAVYDVDSSDHPEKTLKHIILETISISKKYGSMLEIIDSSQLDTKDKEFLTLVEKQSMLEAKVQQFVKKCGVRDSKLAAHTLNSATHGYIHRLLSGAKDITAEKYATYMSQLLLK